MNYYLEKPGITCQTNNRTYLGTHNLIFKTTAECNKDYIKNVIGQWKDNTTNSDTKK